MAPAKPGFSLSTVVQTERLLLRAPRVTDVPELRLLMRKNVEHLRGVSPLPRPGEDPASLTGLSNTLARQRREWRTDRGYSFVLTMRHAERPIIGRIAFNNVVRGSFQNAYLGYWIDGAHQRQGLTTEAVRGALSWAFGTLGLHRVQAAIMPHNAASLRVVEKIGFRREGLAQAYLSIAGTWEDHAIFALTASEPTTPAPAK